MTPYDVSGGRRSAPWPARRRTRTPQPLITGGAPLAIEVARRSGIAQSILVVEDQGPSRSRAVPILRSAGYIVADAYNPSEALASITGGYRFDLLLSDIVLPEMSGIELAACALDADPALGALFMSGHLGRAVELDIDTSAVERILAKPFTAPELLAAVRRALANPRG